jgi:hypothetical protein
MAKKYSECVTEQDYDDLLRDICGLDEAYASMFKGEELPVPDADASEEDWWNYARQWREWDI